MWKNLPVKTFIDTMYTVPMKNKVQKYRWDKGWTESQLSRKSGVSKSTINNLENGKTTNPSTEVAFRLADALGVDVRELFSY